MRKIADCFADIAALAGSLGLLVAVAVVMIDVLGRVIGVTLMRGAIDIVSIATVLAGSFAVAKSVRADINIRVEILTGSLPARLRRFLDRFWFVVGAVLFGTMAIRTLMDGLTSYDYGEVLTSLGISVLVFGILACGGFAFGAVAALMKAFEDER